MKKCSKCGVPQELVNFRSDRTRKDGLSYWCKTCSDKKNKGWNAANQERTQEHCRQWGRRHAAHRRAYNAKYAKDHPEWVVATRRKIEKERYHKDLGYRLRRVLRGRVRNAIADDQKAGSAVSDLGCTVPELRTWLEAKFYPHPLTGEVMTWKNWSPTGWHIDHKRPLVSFDLTDRAQFLDACNFRNLQPLWAFENLAKRHTDLEQRA